MQTEELYRLFLASTGISTDTRRIDEGKIFFALRGENFNANIFAKEALEKGAMAVVVDENHFPGNDKIIRVKDVLQTLQQLAHFHRRQLQAKIIAICGSNGKTTTKELTARVLQTKFRIFATEGNLNNHIGVPLSLLSIPTQSEIAIIEMGANHLGETKLLCDIAEPDSGLITNNGKDHLEGYGSIEGVRKGNGELYDFLRKENKPAFVSADQPDLLQMSEGMQRITYGMKENADCSGTIAADFPFLEIVVPKSGRKISTQLYGTYNFSNVMAAICIGHYFKVDEEKIEEAIASYIPSNNRSQVLRKGSNIFILDAYNANPSSMEAALDNFAALPVSNKVIMLGDMLELGAESLPEHAALINSINKHSFEKVILVGSEFERALPQSNHNLLHFKDVTALKEWFTEREFADHYFLLKGSRRIGLEKVLG
jgi:UDP-N-acetylmuramoyl-tripeptide--D-alanyl-D-alanine ligase